MVHDDLQTQYTEAQSKLQEVRCLFKCVSVCEWVSVWGVGCVRCGVCDMCDMCKVWGV